MGCTHTPWPNRDTSSRESRCVAALQRLSHIGGASAQQQQQQQLDQPPNGSCACLELPSGQHSLLSPVLTAALQQRVLLAHPQVMPLVSALVATAAEVASLMHCNSSRSSSSWSLLDEEEMLQAGNQLRLAAAHVFPEGCFQLQQHEDQQQQHRQQQQLRDGAVEELLKEAPKERACLPRAYPRPMLLDRPLTDRQDGKGFFILALLLYV